MLSRTVPPLLGRQTELAVQERDACTGYGGAADQEAALVRVRERARLVDGGAHSGAVLVRPCDRLPGPDLQVDTREDHLASVTGEADSPSVGVGSP
jgi:hypothetical protein